MNPSRLVVLIVAGFGLLLPPLVDAQAPSAPPIPSPSAPPFTPDKEFSADQVATSKIGISMTGKIYMSDGKARAETEMQGMQVISIMRPDQKKMFMVMPAQKMVMVMNLDDKMMTQINAASGDDGKFDAMGPDTVDGVAATKYKMTTKDGKIFYWWVAVATKTPVKMTADDGSFTLNWKNYKAGPQDAALFEPPKDYQTMEMPGGGGMPGMPGVGGQ
jgi:hypothetical protein